MLVQKISLWGRGETKEEKDGREGTTEQGAEGREEVGVASTGQ